MGLKDALNMHRGQTDRKPFDNPSMEKNASYCPLRGIDREEKSDKLLVSDGRRMSGTVGSKPL